MNLFLDAIAALARRVVSPSRFNSAEWRTVAPAIRQRSFFSATVNSARVLTRLKYMLQNWQQASVEQITNVNTGLPDTVYKVNGLADFRERAADFMISEGLASPDDFADQRISNPISNSRLQLIFNTNTEQAAMFAEWQQRMTDEGYLNQFPCAQFLRTPGAKEPRPLHVQNEGQIRRWDDWEFWLRMNNAEIGGFQVPWGPWGFNSYMYQQPVRRKVCEELGIIRKGEVIKRPDVTRWGVTLPTRYNFDVDAETDNLDPQLADQMREELRNRLGPQAIGADGRPTLDALKQALRM